VRIEKRLIAALLIASGLAACSSPTSFVVLALKSDTPITGVTTVIVTVTKNNQPMKTLTYHHDALTIDQTSTTTLSVSFSGSETGTVSFVVDARNDSDCTVGKSIVSTNIAKGARTDLAVALAPTNDCTHADGGTGGGGDGGTRFPGCNPAAIECDAGMTCQVNCASMLGQCIQGGTGAPGSICAHNSDCTPGTQCFDYSGTGCAVKVCLRFCDSTAQCAQPGDGGVGPGSLCQGPVQCGGVVTGYHTCTFSCDPRPAAVGLPTNGCPPGLACLALGTLDEVDCACPEPTRTGNAGDNCTRSTDCRPGLICNTMTGTQKCRALCRCNAQGSSCTASPPNDCASGTVCTPLTGNTIYGVCL